MLRKLLVRVGSGVVSSVTVGVSAVGPPPTLMIQLLASATYVGSPEDLLTHDLTSTAANLPQ